MLGLFKFFQNIEIDSDIAPLAKLSLDAVFSKTDFEGLSIILSCSNKTPYLKILKNIFFICQIYTLSLQKKSCCLYSEDTNPEF